MYKVIELADGSQYMELSRINHENKRYLFVVSLVNEAEYLFLQISENGDALAKVKDENLIKHLMQKVYAEISEKVNAELAKNKK